MAELARGSVTDRPWGRTLAALGLRAVTGQLTLLAEGKHFLIAFEHGAVVAAASPLASDAAVRVALTSHLVSSSQVPEISRRQAAAPERDEVDVIAELARLGPEHALRLRRRVIAQRAARTFSINHGDFLVTDATELHVLASCELDIRAIIYMGARSNLSEQRLAGELAQLGGWFRLKAAIDDDLPQFGFTDLEQPVVERLRDGGTLAELEDFATTFVDARTVRAVVYALAAYNACDVAPPPRRNVHPTVPPAFAATQPLPKVGSPVPPPRAFTQPIPRTLTPPGSEPLARGLGGEPPRTTTPRGAQPLARTVTPDRAARPPAVPQTEPMTTFPPDEGAVIRPVPQTEPMTTFPPDEGAALPRARRPSAPPPRHLASEGLDPPTQRDRSSAPQGAPSARDRAGPRADRSSPAIARPDDPRRRHPTDEPRRDGSEPTGRQPAADSRRGGSDPALRYPGDDARRAGSDPALRYPADDARRAGSDPALRYAADDARRAGSDPALRYPVDDARRAGSDPTLRFAADDARRAGSDPALRYPAEALEADGAARPGATTERDISALGFASDDGSAAFPPPRRIPEADRSPPPPGGARAQGTTAERDLPGLDGPSEDGSAGFPPPRGTSDPRDASPPRARATAGAATSGTATAAGSTAAGSTAAGSTAASSTSASGNAVVVRRVAASRPPAARQVVRTDSPASHNVKALIAQRLKLLDHGADHFQLLGIGPESAPDAIRKAYFALARQLHPDRLAALGISDDGKHAQRLFAQINAGFAILSDHERRASYVSVLRRGGEAAIQAEQARAEELARRILDAEDAFHRGELALRRDLPQAAVAELERAIQLNPEEADYHALLAWSQFCAAPDKAAVASSVRGQLDKAIQRSPLAVTARLYLGRVERMLGRDAEAARHFREVLEAAPGHTDAASELRVIEARLPPDKPSGGGLFGRKR